MVTFKNSYDMIVSFFIWKKKNGKINSRTASKFRIIPPYYPAVMMM